MVIIPALIVKNQETLLRLTYFDELFARKDKFEKFINNSRTINLVTGSSHAKDFFDVNVLGKNWFTYANGAQYLELSLIQLESIAASKIRIDTLLISMDMFDLAPLPPEVNFNYSLYKVIYGKKKSHDCLSLYLEDPVGTFANDIKLLKKILRNIFLEFFHESNPRLSRMQVNGFLPKDDSPFFDSRKNIFYKKLEYEYRFDSLANFAKVNNITLILVETPKSASYFRVCSSKNLDAWRKFKIMYKNKYPWIKIFDFEYFHSSESLFVDMDHPNSAMRNVLTDTLRNSIKNLTGAPE
jgi:hypothetical protein